jgi:hypothetical protein
VLRFGPRTSHWLCGNLMDNLETTEGDTQWQHRCGTDLQERNQQ